LNANTLSEFTQRKYFALGGGFVVGCARSAHAVKLRSGPQVFKRFGGDWLCEKF
jgi:hypothetical protein